MSRMRKWSEVPWREPEDDEDEPLTGVIPPDPRTALMALLDGKPIRARRTVTTPLMLADDDGDGFQIIMWRTHLDGLAADTICVALPGLCQHFTCGDHTATVSLN